MEKTPDAGRACAGGSDREDGAMPSCFSGAGLAAISQGAFPERSRQLFLGRVQRRHIGLKLGGKFLDRKQTPAATRENSSVRPKIRTVCPKPFPSWSIIVEKDIKIIPFS